MRGKEYCNAWEMRDYFIERYGKTYSTDSINAQIRALRSSENCSKYGLQSFGDNVQKRKITIDEKEYVVKLTAREIRTLDKKGIALK